MDIRDRKLLQSHSEALGDKRERSMLCSLYVVVVSPRVKHVTSWKLYSNKTIIDRFRYFASVCTEG